MHGTIVNRVSPLETSPSFVVDDREPGDRDYGERLSTVDPVPHPHTLERVALRNSRKVPGCLGAVNQPTFRLDHLIRRLDAGP
jgi:hypothetical protein